MKAFFVLFTLLPMAANAASVELICEPNARITFHNRWVRGSIVKVESTGTNWNLPWTGRESLILGRQIREERIRELQVSEAGAFDELLAVVPDESRFITYRQSGKGKNPLVNVLYIDRDLLENSEQDGLVVAEQHQTLEIEKNQPSSKVSVFHCRSR